MGALEWLQSLPVSIWVAESDWGYPLLLSVHSVGMATVVGLLLMLDCRVLGFAPQVPVTAFRRFMPYAWAGFALNFASGALLFASTAQRLVSNWPFVLKMLAITAGGMLSRLLWRELGTASVTEPVISRRARGVAGMSLAVWLLAIVCGRLIAYVMDHSILSGA
jgi:hypothetical protein